ncbi:MAG: hypothetical protein WA705_16990 [Candidatus Ozemobacteraceae bacterium]
MGTASDRGGLSDCSQSAIFCCGSPIKAASSLCDTGFGVTAKAFPPVVVEACWDESVLVEDSVVLPVQVNGKLRDQIRVSVALTDEQVRAECMKSEKVQKYLEGKTIVKFIHVAKRMASFVVK